MYILICIYACMFHGYLGKIHKLDRSILFLKRIGIRPLDTTSVLNVSILLGFCWKNTNSDTFIDFS